MRWVVTLSFLLSACSADISIGRGPPASFVLPPNEKVVAEPNGALIAEPVAAPIDTLITGLSQAQTTRSLVRQLAR